MVKRQATFLYAAYGTLRPAGSLHKYIRDSMIDFWPSKVEGTMFAAAGGAFPVAFLASSNSEIVTTTMECKFDQNMIEVINMEIGTGYKLMEVDELNRDSEPTGRKVFVFEYDGPLSSVGKQIPSGDWYVYLAEQEEKRVGQGQTEMEGEEACG